MRKIIGVLLGVAVALSARPLVQSAQLDSGRKLDSAHVFQRNPLRVDQLGYRPSDPGKFAWAAMAGGGSWSVLRLPDSAVVLSGTLQSVGTHVRPTFSAKGYYAVINTLWSFVDTAEADSEVLARVDMSALQTPGRYVLSVQGKYSDPFVIADTIYAHAQERLGWFFGAQRCGNEPSWLHGACHLHDGSALSANLDGALVGGWHDCGDHIKSAFGIGYAGMMLALSHALRPGADGDRMGNRAGEAPDGVPDLLRESLVGADYIYKLYAVSKARGMLSQGDMVNGIVSIDDHQYWGLPENQDGMSVARGGAPRAVQAGTGSDVAGLYIATLALTAKNLKATKPLRADSLLTAATEIYDSILKANPTKYTQSNIYYPSSSNVEDEEAMAALTLWWATGENRFRVDLMENTSLGSNSYASYTDGSFPAGFLAKSTPFSAGGWTTDYQHIHSIVLYAMAKLVLPDVVTATRYGVTSTVRDSLLEDVLVAIRTHVHNGTDGTDSTTYPGIRVLPPYSAYFHPHNGDTTVTIWAWCLTCCSSPI